jgi:hypothetical protein
MREEELTCVRCGVQLSTNFLGKAEARDWNTDKLTCSEHFSSVNGAHLVPTE